MGFRFHFGKPQRAAAFVLLVFLAECIFVIGRLPMSESDYRYALCGREMWEKPAPALGYFTTCGNMQGDGTLAYRAAGLPFTIYLKALNVEDWFASRVDSNKPAAERTYTPNPTGGSIYDLRHQIVGIPYLLRVPFASAGVLLGGCLWWVTRRLFGNLPGMFALLLYCLSPAVLSFATSPNNEIFASWGIFAGVYTGIGIAHAMHGPVRKWRPRIVLFTVILGLTACAHLLAAVLAAMFSALFMLYIAERRRSLVLPIILGSGFGATLILFASYTFRPGPFLYAFTAGSARLTLSATPIAQFLSSFSNLPLATMVGLALLLYLLWRHSRFFGNTAPLLVALSIVFVVTMQAYTDPIIWAVPFLLTFAVGVIADAFETRYRKMFLALAGTAVAAQAVILILNIQSTGR